MPPGPALTPRLCRVLLVLAVLAVDGSEPLAGPELHPPRFLLLIAHAARQESTAVGRGFWLPGFVLVVPFSSPDSFPLNGGFGGDPGDLDPDLASLSFIACANVVVGGSHALRVAASFLAEDADNNVLLLFHRSFDMCGNS